MITGLSKGEAIKNDMDGPNGALDESNPAKIGMVEQEQKGVSDPSAVPYTYPFHPLGRLKMFLILSSGTSCWIQLTRKLMPTKSNVNSANKKNKIL